MTLQSWFGFPMDKSEECGSYKGMTTRDTCTEGVDFFPLKEMLPFGSIVLKTEQEAALPTFLRRGDSRKSFRLARNGIHQEGSETPKTWED